MTRKRHGLKDFGTTGTWDETQLVELARRLKAADMGGWREPALRTVIEDFGWQGQGTESGPLLLRGPEREASDAADRLRPTGRFEKDYAHGGEEYVGLYVPVGRPESSPAGKAQAFRTAAETLTEEFGRAPIMGTYGEAVGLDAPHRREAHIYGGLDAWGLSGH